MRAILVRHYKTIINAEDCIMGWGDSPPVQEWEYDLLKVYENLQKNSIEIDAVYSSSLERARQTALYFAHNTNIASVKQSPELNEVNYGTLFQKSKKWVRKNIPEYKTDADYIFPEGESFRQMQKRSTRFVLSLAEKIPDKTVLFVVHAGVIRGLICTFLDLDFDANLKQRISHQYIGDFQLRNGRCTRYDELGKPSGFASDGVLSLPFTRSD